jgi:methylated-DNA-protein-cysteine methyltransferase-like protein
VTLSRVPPPRETFYDLVYAFVHTVPAGRVVTYGQVAFELGSPAAARAVGYALNSLPADSGVPWWRVVNAGGAISLRGRSDAASQQRALLEAEGVTFDGDRIDLGVLRYWPGEPPGPPPAR